MHMEIQFLCYDPNGNGYAAPVDYDGCMVRIPHCEDFSDDTYGSWTDAV